MRKITYLSIGISIIIALSGAAAFAIRILIEGALRFSSLSTNEIMEAEAIAEEQQNHAQIDT